MRPSKYMRVPGEHIHGKGWMLGEVDGALFYTDGCAMFRCKGKPPEPNCRLPKHAMQEGFNACVRGKQVPLRRLRLKKDRVVFSGDVGLQRKYFRRIRRDYPDADFLSGAQFEGLFSVLAAEKDGTVVAVVMPLRPE